jgi:folylpolyglutamate synthase
MSDDQKDLYESAIAALFSSLHQSTTKEAIQKAAQRRKLTVQDMRSYWNCLQYPATKKKNKKMIHITGTKGKGSTACFCESVLRQNGYSTGLFTSPHLIDIRERIRWNFQPIHTQIFGRAYWKIRKDLELNQKDADLPKLPGYFRMLTLMAYYIFFHEIHVDVIIIEVGIGGRYDATNFWDVRPEDQVVCGVTKLDLE